MKTVRASFSKLACRILIVLSLSFPVWAHQPVMDMAPRWEDGWGFQLRHEYRWSDDLMKGDSDVSNPSGRKRRIHGHPGGGVRDLLSSHLHLPPLLTTKACGGSRHERFAATHLIAAGSGSAFILRQFRIFILAAWIAMAALNVADLDPRKWPAIADRSRCH